MNNHETRLEEMASVIVGEKLEGWTITSATVKREDLHPWVRLTLLAKATNGKGDVNTFRYQAGQPLNQLAKFAEALL